MSNIGKPEPETQQRVIALFKDEPGYRFLGGCRLFDSPDEDTLGKLQFTGADDSNQYTFQGRVTVSTAIVSAFSGAASNIVLN